MKAPSPAQLESMVQEVVRRIVAGYDPLRIILFGSVAGDAWHAGSDIDLAVIKDVAEPFVERAGAVLRLLRGIPCGVDVLVYTPEEFASMLGRGSPFATEIATRGKVVYERPGG